MSIAINSAHLAVQRRLITSASALAVLAAASFQPAIALAEDAATADKPDATLEEVVVTAERRTVNLQDTNLAASSLGAVEL